MSTPQMSLLFASLALAANAVVLGGLGLAVAARFRPGAAALRDRILASIEGQTLWLAWIPAVVATLGSLYYSEIANFEPCKYCWFQRIAMYPLAVMLLIAAVRRDGRVRVYAAPLAGIGFPLAVYHYMIQQFPALSSGECSAVGPPCTAAYVAEFQFGGFFVSIPYMAFSAFALILLFLAADRRLDVPVPDPEA